MWDQVFHRERRSQMLLSTSGYFFHLSIKMVFYIDRPTVSFLAVANTQADKHIRAKMLLQVIHLQASGEKLPSDNPSQYKALIWH